MPKILFNLFFRLNVPYFRMYLSFSCKNAVSYLKIQIFGQTKAEKLKQ